MSIEVSDEENMIHHVGTVAVYSRPGCMSALSFELLSALYEDLDLHLISHATHEGVFDSLLPKVGRSNVCSISLDCEVICPALALFDSSIFAFNYQNFEVKFVSP